jgi:hypothetical protein
MHESLASSRILLGLLDPDDLSKFRELFCQWEQRSITELNLQQHRSEELTFATFVFVSACLYLGIVTELPHHVSRVSRVVISKTEDRMTSTYVTLFKSQTCHSVLHNT